MNLSNRWSVSLVAVTLLLGACVLVCSARGDDSKAERGDDSKADSSGVDSQVEFVLRSRSGGNPGEASCVAAHKKVVLDMKETAIVVVDMWTTHWCKRMTESGRQLAPKINDYITEARKRGATIIHCPSGGTGHYKDHQALANMKDVPSMRAAPNGHLLRGWNRRLDAEPYAMMIDRTPLAGCPCDGRCHGKVGTRQLDAIKIHDDDYITQSGTKLVGLLVKKKIKNVFYTGAAIERCVLGRPFGMRHMKASGFDAHLVRDLVDGMHLYPWMKDVPHLQSNQMSLEHVERFIAPTVISASLLASDKQEKLSRQAVDNDPSLRLALVTEGTFGEAGTFRIYRRVGTNVHECVAFVRKVKAGKHEFDLSSVLESKEFDWKVRGIQALLDGRIAKADLSKEPKALGVSILLDKDAPNVVFRLTLEGTSK